MARVLALVLFISIAFATQKWHDAEDLAGQFPQYGSLRPVVYNGAIYSFGGFTENQGTNNNPNNIWSNDVWTLIPDDDEGGDSGWSVLTTTGTKPTPRGYHISFVRGNSLYVAFGGSYDTFFQSVVQTNELSALNLDTLVWSQVSYTSTINPSGLFAPSFWYDATRDSFYIFGGINYKSFQDKADTWKFDFSTNGWTKFDFTGRPQPTKRHDASGAYHLNRKFYMYGGELLTLPSFTFSVPTDVQWTFDVLSETWIQEFPSGSPNPPRNNGNGMVVNSDGNLVLYGGDIGGGQSCQGWFPQNSVTETWVYNTATSSWSLLNLGDVPPPLKRAGSITFGRRIYLFGGFYFDSQCGLQRNQDTYYLKF